uniref:WD repeat-containing protein 18 n=1 Tax=Parascaris univalens TaxID=6257 RepID=A0A915AJG5_PARUN
KSRVRASHEHRHWNFCLLKPFGVGDDLPGCLTSVKFPRVTEVGNKWPISGQIERPYGFGEALNRIINNSTLSHRFPNFYNRVECCKITKKNFFRIENYFILHHIHNLSELLEPKTALMLSSATFLLFCCCCCCCCCSFKLQVVYVGCYLYGIGQVCTTKNIQHRSYH